MLRPLLVLAVVLLSGCSGTRHPGTATGIPTNSAIGHSASTSSQPEPTANATLALIPRHLEANNCTYQGTVFTWPTAIAPGSYPPGWDPPTPIATNIILDLYNCQRIALGRFERPVQIITESHTKESIPEQCHKGGNFGVDNILNHAWVNDRELALFLKQSFGMPADYADISTTDDSNAAALHATWNWKQDGFAGSSLDLKNPHTSTSSSSIDLRLSWWNGTVLGAIDLAQSGQYPDPGSNTVATGNMEAPTLQASTGVKQWVGGGTWATSFQMSGQIMLWSDPGCKHPI